MSDDFMNNNSQGRDGYSWKKEENGKPNRPQGSGHTPRPRINRNFRPAGSSKWAVRRRREKYRIFCKKQLTDGLTCANI